MSETATATTATERFAAFTASLDAKALPRAVAAQAKWAILDLLGVALGGAELPFARVVREYFGELGGRPEAMAIGVRDRLPAVNAALVNAVCGHTLDMQDVHRCADGHPGGVIPAALAAGELADASGADLIAATVAGYEVFIRVARLMNPARLERGFHTTGTILLPRRRPRQRPPLPAHRRALRRRDRLPPRPGQRDRPRRGALPRGGAAGPAHRRERALAARLTKELATRCFGLPLEQALRLRDYSHLIIRAGEDSREGRRAFAEKRQPVYTGQIRSELYQ